MGLVWVISFVITLKLDTDSLSTVWSVVLKFASAFNIALLFELLLMYWDICLSLTEYYVEPDHSFKLQCRTVPFMIIAFPFGFMAMGGGYQLLLYVAILFCAKTGLHHTVASIDKFKIPAGYDIPESI